MSEDGEKVLEFEAGEYAEEMPWEIRRNANFFDSFPPKKVCKHFKNNTIPWAVFAQNEGGYNSTWVCLECILDGANQIDQLKSYFGRRKA